MIVTFLPLFLRHLPTLPVVSGPQDMLSLCSKAELRLAMPPAQPLTLHGCCLLRVRMAPRAKYAFSFATLQLSNE